MLFPKSLTAACDEHSVSEVHADSGTETLGHRLRDHVIILHPKFPPLFLSTALVTINNCAVLISWMRKLLTFLTPFSEEGLCFLAPSSGVYQLVLQSQAKALLQPRSLTCSWAVQPYSKPRNLQIKVGEEDDSVKGMFSVLYHRQQPQRAKIPYLKLRHFI